MPIRTFIAIEIPEYIKENILQSMSTIKNTYPKISWTKSTAFHITLKFLGDVEKKMIVPIGDKIEEIAKDFSPFKLDVGGVGVFPNKRSPKVLWTGLHMPDNSLIDLQKKIECGLEEIGFAQEKRAFKPHLTLGRVKHRASPQFIDDFFKCSISTQSFTVDKIIVMKSDLKSTGAVYTPLNIIELIY